MVRIEPDDHAAAADDARDQAAQFIFGFSADGFSPFLKVRVAFVEDDDFLAERDGGGGEFLEAGSDGLEGLRCGFGGTGGRV